ncbi:MAG: esterase/lipase family protein, partial [Planctomycetaceae bacterium]
VTKIHFVVHSMGGLVVRSYLAKHAAGGPDDPRFGRMVMMGVPNLGAHLADRLQQNWAYKAVFGPAGRQLVSGEEGVIAELPTPEFEFGILAGARGTNQGFNLLIPGDDDGTVGVASTRLPGAADFVTVSCLHSWIVRNDAAIAYTRHFLKTGRFREEGDPQPIPLPEQNVEASP